MPIMITHIMMKKIRQLDDENEYYFLFHKLQDIIDEYFPNNNVHTLSACFKKEFGFTYSELRMQDFEFLYNKYKDKYPTGTALAKAFNIPTSSFYSYLRKTGLELKCPNKSHKNISRRKKNVNN